MSQQSGLSLLTSKIRLQVFINRCFRRFLKNFCPNTISNGEVLARTDFLDINSEIHRRKFGWIGEVKLRLEPWYTTHNTAGGEERQKSSEDALLSVKSKVFLTTTVTTSCIFKLQLQDVTDGGILLIAYALYRCSSESKSPGKTLSK